MIKKILGVAVALVVSNAAIADSYRTEITAGATDSDATDTSFDLGIRYHFQEVDTSGKPLAEAAFLNKSSNVYAETVNIAGDGDTETTAGVEFYLPNTMFYGGFDVTKTDDNTSWTATLGVTPIDGLLVTTSYKEDVDYDLNLDAKYVTTLGNGHAINLEAKVIDGEEDVLWSLGGDYYLSNNTSLGLAFSDYTGNDTDVTVRGRHFFSNEFFAGASFTAADNNDTIALEAGLRF